MFPVVPGPPSTMRAFPSVPVARAEKSIVVAPEAEKIKGKGGQGSYNTHNEMFDFYGVTAGISWI